MARARAHTQCCVHLNRATFLRRSNRFPVRSGVLRHERVTFSIAQALLIFVRWRPDDVLLLLLFCFIFFAHFPCVRPGQATPVSSPRPFVRPQPFTFTKQVPFMRPLHSKIALSQPAALSVGHRGPADRDSCSSSIALLSANNGFLGVLEQLFRRSVSHYLRVKQRL